MRRTRPHVQRHRGQRSCWVKGTINYKYINKRLGQMAMRETFRERSQPDPDSFRVILRGLRSIKAKRIY